jgi:hypothetical protein
MIYEEAELAEPAGLVTVIRPSVAPDGEVTVKLVAV